jgi:hypothetical protein
MIAKPGKNTKIRISILRCGKNDLLYNPRNTCSTDTVQGATVQSWISTNPGLNFNLVFLHVWAGLFQNFRKWKGSVDYFHIYKQAVRKIALNILLTSIS